MHHFKYKKLCFVNSQSFFLISSLICCISQNVSTTPYEITEIINNGAFFTAVSNLSFYSSEWTIVANLKIDNYTGILNNAQNLKDRLVELCQSLPTTRAKSECFHTQATISHLFIQLNHTNIELQNLFHHFPQRKRREIFDGVGRLTHYLFGTMDDKDSKNIYERLKTLENSDSDNFHLIQEQVTVVKTNYNKLIKPIEHLENTTNELLEKTNEIIQQHEILLKHDKTIEEHNAITFELTTIQTALIMSFLEIQQQQTLLLSMISSLRNHRLHPLLITTEEILKILSEISNEFRINKKYMSIQNIHQIIKIDYVLGNQEFIITVKIPIPEEDTYELYKLFLTPIKNTSNNTVLIDTDIEYLAMNKNLQKFTILSEII